MERLDLGGNNELEGKTSSDESSTHYLIRLNSNEKNVSRQFSHNGTLWLLVRKLEF